MIMKMMMKLRNMMNTLMEPNTMKDTKWAIVVGKFLVKNNNYFS